MMLKIIKNGCGGLSRKFNIIAYLTAENLALRQQFIVLKRNQLYWRRKSRAGKRGGRALDSDVTALILKIADANPLWGAPKIYGVLLKLGIVVSERTESGVLRRRKRKPPSQAWRTFIKNHMPDLMWRSVAVYQILPSRKNRARISEDDELASCATRETGS